VARRFHQSEDLASGGDLALQRRATESGDMVGGTEFVQQSDDAFAAEVGGVAERRSPTGGGGAASHFVKEIGMLLDQSAKGLGVGTPDGVDELAGLDEARPTRDFVSASEDVLSVGEFGGRRIERLGMKFAKFGEGLWIAAAKGAE